MTKYELGVVSVSFRSHSPEEILAMMKAAGLNRIEWGSDIHAPCRDIERLTLISRLQKEYGVLCSSYGTYFRLGETPVAELSDYISAAKLLGTDILRLWCGGKSSVNMTEEERDTLIAQCRQAAEIAEESGVILCLECHRNTFTERLEDALYLMREINSPSFRMYWQPFQWESVENNLSYAEAISPFVNHVHVFQWKDTQKFSLNEGMDEWRNYLGKLPAPRTLLLEFMPDNSINTLTREADALRRIVDGI